MREQLAALTRENRLRPTDGIARELVRLRHDAFTEVGGEPAAGWPPVLSDPFPDVDGLPETTREHLTAALVGGAIRHHGCLIVRGLFPKERVDALVDDTDRAFRARDEARAGAGATDPWYAPFEPGPHAPALTESQRQWVHDCDAIWAADSPPALFDVTESFDQAGVPQLLEDIFGEPAALTVNKCTLRRVRPGAMGSWHQDGSFLGDGIRTVSVWVALSECGDETDAPGLGIVPRRVDHILPTHIEGTSGEIAVGLAGLVEALEGNRPVRPTFAAGDALLFDELLVHSTGGTPGVSRVRYALESWFFAGSTIPPTYVPLAL